ncbi:MAG: protein kinase domain-containing protein, partial [Candidatus Xenobia bacterium]
HYLVMDYIDGCSLDQILKSEGPQPESRVLGWASRLCDVLEYLHDQKPPVIFRDLKPANVMLDGAGMLHLIDFGIAKGLDADRTGTCAHQSATPGFAAPEQYGGRSDARSDIYSLGATLHALLSGQTPPHAIERATGASFQPAGSASIAPTIAWMMQLPASNRPQSIAEARQALTRAVPPAPAPRMPWRRILAAGGACAVLMIFVLAFVTIRAGLQSRSVPPRLAGAALHIESQPAGSDVFLDGRYEGKSPLELRDLVPHTYDIRIEHQGFLTTHRAVSLESGDSRQIAVQLQRRF